MFAFYIFLLMKTTFKNVYKFHKLEKELEKKLADLDAEIERVEKAQLDEKGRQHKEQAKTQWQDAEYKLKGKSKLNAHAAKIIDTLKVQLIPSLECVEPNDKFVKDLFLFGSNAYKKH